MFRDFELYMIAIMPPEPLSSQIHKQRLDFALRYGFRRGLKPPVHITLVPPFKVPMTQVTAFESDIKRLASWTQQQTPFRIVLDDFGFFDHPAQRSPVLFINVLKSARLNALYNDIKVQLADYPFIKPVLHSGYQPHATLGYRDLSRAVFPAIKADYTARHFNASFECTRIFLWKHDAVNWQIHGSFRFASAETY